MRRTPQHPRPSPPARLAGLLLMAALLAGCLPAPTPAPEKAAPPAGDPTPPLKISVAEDGLYALDAATLARAGWQAEALDPARLHLLAPGGEQPLRAEGRGASLRLLFCGQASGSPYTQENVYWLVEEEDRERIAGWLAEVEEAPAAEDALDPAYLEGLPPQTYLHRARQEQNQVYVPQAEGGEHWFWARLSAPGSETFELGLPDLASGAGRLRLALWAATEAPASPDHRLLLTLNGRALPEQTWDGTGRRLLELPLPEGLLREGANTLLVEAPGLEASPAETVYIDWIELVAPRPYAALGGRLAFTAPGGPAELSGFSAEPLVCERGGTEPGGPPAARLLSAGDGLQDLGGGRWRLETRAGARYLAAGPEGLLAPAGIEPARTGPDLRAETRGAAYLAVGPQDLLDPLQPLLDYRQAAGLSALALPLEAVYDQFGGGRPEPQAVVRLLQHAALHWRAAPQYLLLVGDASYDPRGYLAPPEANRLPVFLVSTRYGGETGSDLPFALLDGDDLPDLALGRLPARSPEQVRVYVEKALAYEQAARPAPASVLAVADGRDPLFEAEAQAFLGLFPEGVQRDLYAPPAGAEGGADELRRRFGQGYSLIAYFGHGGLQLWSQDRLFSNAEVAALEPAKSLPISIQMTCLTGLFTHPGSESLAESLLWQPGAGAVAVLAPTSLTLPAEQGPLSRELALALLSGPETTLGQALLEARRAAAASPDSREVLLTFLLLGDPALRVNLSTDYADGRR